MTSGRSCDGGTGSCWHGLVAVTGWGRPDGYAAPRPERGRMLCWLVAVTGPASALGMAPGRPWTTGGPSGEKEARPMENSAKMGVQEHPW